MIFVNPSSLVNKDIPNIGLAYAATHFNTKVIDLNTKLEQKDRFLNFKVDVLGISVKSLTYSESVRIANLYKEKYPYAKIKSICGFLDVQCCYPYLNFEDKIEYDEPFSDKYPFPNYELFDSFNIFQESWQKGNWGYAIMTSQGCPYQCTYCISRNRKWLARSAENCLEELKIAKGKWKIKIFNILDDCFNIDKKRTIEFCEKIKILSLKWICANGIRCDRFDEDIAKAMRDAGCIYVGFGIESTSDEVLQSIKKGEKFSEIEKAIDIAKKYFRQVNGYFIIGLPKSSYEKDLQSFIWSVKKKINANFSYYVPFDKNILCDNIFYGENASPQSDEYDKNLQKKIFEMTSYMRPDTKIGVLKRTFLNLKYVLLFDTKNFHLHIFDILKRVIGKLNK